METSVESNPTGTKPTTTWSGKHVYAMAAICLASGLLVGYLVRGSNEKSVTISASSSVQAPSGEAAAAAMPTMDQMKHMADKTVEPLLEQLKSKPNDPALLSQIAKAYFSTHQFAEAISYAERAVQADPKNVGNRADLASYQFFSGDADKALANLDEALKVEPGNAQVLFNVGLIRMRAKNDKAGAIAAWQLLLKSNPNLPEDKKQVVTAAIASAKKTATGK